MRDETPERTGEELAGFRVNGSVQGVGYRTWVQRAGCQPGLWGAVRNLCDGSTELRVAGEAVA